MKEKIPPQDKEVQESCMACHSTDFRHASAENRPNLETAQFGVTCVACHDPHQVSPYLDQPPAQNQPCLKCHFKNDKCPGDNPPHPVIPCNKTEVECVDCHMPYVVKSGGFFSIRGHGFRIVGPKEAALQSMPSSCQNGQCHEEKSQQWAISAYSQMILNTGNDYENN